MRKKRGKMRKIFFKKTLFFFTFIGFFLFFCQKNTAFNKFYSVLDGKIKINSKKGGFLSGEKLNYKITYGRKNKKSGALTAANAHLSVIDTIYNNKAAYFLNAFGKTTKLFSLFMKVEHHYSSIIDTANLNTMWYSMDIKEGKYYQKTELSLKVDSLLTTQNNDLLGLGYRLRTTENLKNQIGDTIFFDYHYQDRYYKSHLKIMKEEIIKTKFGKIKALKLSPLLEKGRVFKSESGAFIWVSSDKMRIPLKIELPVLVGSIYVSLDSYQNTLFYF